MPKLTFVRPLQPLNAYSPIHVTALGILNSCDILATPLKAYLPMVCNELGKTVYEILVPTKA